MPMQLYKDKIKASIFILVYMISLNTPYALAQIGIVKGLFIGIRIICTGMMILFCFSQRMKWNKFDIAAIFFCACFLMSAMHAGFSTNISVAPLSVYLYNAIARIVFILGQLLAIKIIFSMQRESSRIVLKIIFWYYTILCFSNLITQILLGELPAETGNTFFLGLDNEVGKYYLYAVFYCCVNLIMEGKRFSKELALVIVITVIEAVYRKIGGLTVLSIFMTGLAVLLYFAPKAKIWQVKQEVLLGGMIGIYVLGMVSYTKLDILQKFINTYLYGKDGAVRIRITLLFEFLSRWTKSPLFGWGSIIGGIERGDSSWLDYALAGGHTHNYLIDSLYNYGIFALILYLYLLFSAVKKIDGKDAMVSFLGMIFMLIVLRGMFENGCQHIFSVLPNLYYLGNMLDEKKADIDKEQVCNVQKF